MQTSVTHFSPNPALMPYIEKYTLRKIVLGEGETIEKLMPYRTLTSLEFFIVPLHKKFDLETDEEKDTLTSSIRGLRTFSKYKIQLSDHFVSLTVKFQPSGMYGLLGIPMKRLTNKDIPLYEIDIFPVGEIENRLRQAGNDDHYPQIIEEYFLELYRERTFEMRLQPLLTPRMGNLSIATVADEVGVSIRQAERIFLEEVGLTFAKYKQLMKFDAAVKHKIANPEIPWIDLAYQFDFYDQPHFVKTFKKHLNIAPSQFDPSDFAF